MESYKSTQTQLEILDLRHFRAPVAPSARNRGRAGRSGCAGTTKLHRTAPAISRLAHPARLRRPRPRTICGFTFCVYEGQKAVVGDAFAIKTGDRTPAEITTSFSPPARAPPPLARTSHASSPSFCSTTKASIDDTFLKPASHLPPPLHGVRPPAVAGANPASSGSNGSAHPKKPVNLPPDIELRRWSAAHYQAAAELIHESYLGPHRRPHQRSVLLPARLAALPPQHRPLPRLRRLRARQPPGSLATRQRSSSGRHGSMLARAPTTSPTSPSSASPKGPRQGTWRSPDALLHVIVRSLTRNDHIMHMALAQAGAGDPNEPRILCSSAIVAHPR
jgi:hypothetical protein